MQNTLTLNTQDLDRYYQLEQSTIYDYLESILAEYEFSGNQGIFLPSMVCLSSYFHCSAVDVHQALTQLKARGCDFLIMGFDSPITLWHPRRIQK